MDTENLAVNAVDDAISSTDMLTPMFNKKDREPLWDGNIFVYEDKKKDNKSLIGRIPVQIKGKEAKLLNRKQTTFRIPLTNLKKYRSEGGVMYFVVLMRREEDGELERVIYYNALLPYDINNIISRRGSSGSNDRAVVMKKFPTDRRGIYLCCKKFLEDRSNQDYNKDIIPYELEIDKCDSVPVLTIGEFYTNKNFNVIDLSKLALDKCPSIFDIERKDIRETWFFLDELITMISRKLDTKGDDPKEYRPTQVFMKYIQRNTDYCGLEYRSSHSREKDKNSSAAKDTCYALFVTNRNCLDDCERDMKLDTGKLQLLMKGYEQKKVKASLDLVD